MTSPYIQDFENISNENVPTLRLCQRLGNKECFLPILINSIERTSDMLLIEDTQIEIVFRYKKWRCIYRFLTSTKVIEEIFEEC